MHYSKSKLNCTHSLISSNANGSRNMIQTGNACKFEGNLESGCPGNSNLCSSNTNGSKRGWSFMNGPNVPEPLLLALGLHHSPCSSDAGKKSSETTSTLSSVKESDGESSLDQGLNYQLTLTHGTTNGLHKPADDIPNSCGTGNKLDLDLNLPAGPLESAITDFHPILHQHHSNLEEQSESLYPVSYNDEGSTSSCVIFGAYLKPCSQNSDTSANPPFNKKVCTMLDTLAVVPEPLSKMTQNAKCSVACTSGINHVLKRSYRLKKCQFQGCEKGSRGASRFCIAHGGGRRCQKAGCQKGAEGRTIYCKTHGGGRRCQYLGCTKSAEGSTDFCIAHGGGRRCTHEDCTRAARGKSGLCIRHGGGKRCQKENCTKSAEGRSGFCITHGGGRRCHFPSCSKGAQGNTLFCKAHGGGRRCTFSGCTKGAEGSTPFCKGHGGGKRCSFGGGGVCPKSVHGGTQFCVAHGGGKRCAITGCSKSARGRTNFCVRHGGGKRCKSEGCGKSAQGSTDFCKAHGGGRRCSWGQVGSNFGAGAHPCDKFARSKSAFCTVHSSLVQDHCIHGGGTLGLSAIQNAKTVKLEMKEIPTGIPLISKVGSHGGDSTDVNIKVSVNPLVTQPYLPEGRVHGGSLLSMLTHNSPVESNVSVHAVMTHQNISDAKMLQWM